VDPVFLFNPIVGINKHWGIGAGINVQIPLVQDCCPYQLLLFADLENRYYLSNRQCRTFDIKTPKCTPNPWSRYIQVRRNGFEQTTFAANVLTIPVEVKPFNMINIETGFRGFYGGFGAEIGYQLWAHNDEHIRLKHHNCEDDTQRFIGFGLAGTDANSSHNSTIRRRVHDDPNFVSIKRGNLDFRSAASRQAATHMVYGSFSYIVTCSFFEPFINVGAFYEHSHNNAAFTQWGVWAKIGAAL
jgi:hypothetical protein